MLAFNSCTELKSVSIPSSVTAILDNAFTNCPDMNIYYSGSREQWNSITLGYTDESFDPGNTIHFNSFGIPEKESAINVTVNGNIISDHYYAKLKGIQSYRSVSLDMSFDTDIDYAKAKWSSKNTEYMQVSESGHVTNKKFFGRSSDMTVTLFDSNNNAIAQKTVRLVLYRRNSHLDILCRGGANHIPFMQLILDLFGF